VIPDAPERGKELAVAMQPVGLVGIERDRLLEGVLAASMRRCTMLAYPSAT